MKLKSHDVGLRKLSKSGDCWVVEAYLEDLPTELVGELKVHHVSFDRHGRRGHFGLDPIVERLLQLRWSGPRPSSRFPS